MASDIRITWRGIDAEISEDEQRGPLLRLSKPLYQSDTGEYEPNVWEVETSYIETLIEVLPMIQRLWANR